jgi:hypothetical protein
MVNKVQRMELPWVLSDELLTIWYLTNLGETFSNFRATLYQQFNIAGIGTGQPLTLRGVMDRAENEWSRI